MQSHRIQTVKQLCKISSTVHTLYSPSGVPLYLRYYIEPPFTEGLAFIIYVFVCMCVCVCVYV